ncbi:MAG TPA: hypothetical protein VFE46_20030, partial [Pirellulales bacterium]|nr:hypothetical protein [Pirellulales bacterium]
VHYRKGSLLEYNGVYLAEGPWPAKAYFDAKRRARARDAGLYLDYGFSRPAVFSTGPFPQFQNSDGTAGHAGGQPVEAAGEGISTPAPQPEMVPNKQELPAPMPGPAATRPGSRYSPVGNNPTPAAAVPGVGVAGQPEGPRSTLKVSSVLPSASLKNTGATGSIQKNTMLPASTAKNVLIDNQIRQASGEAPFDWGDLSLNSHTTNTSSSNGGWKSTGTDESDATSTTSTNDQPASGWKRAQR